MPTNQDTDPSGHFSSARAAWRDGVRCLNWLLNPGHGLDARRIYELLSTASPTRRGLYLNLGYWRDARDMDEASEALALLLAEAAGIGPGDRVLDCGFGFGDQDMLWARAVGPRHIVGLNVTPFQVSIARKRVAQAGLGNRVELLPGSATAMPIDAESVDRVVALESAFHFRTRERFFREAWRVLCPGGALALADIIPMPAVSPFWPRLQQRLSWGMAASRFAIPSENADTRPVYVAKLAMAGFEDIQVRSIRDAVFAPLHGWLREHPEALERLHPLARQAARFALRIDPEALFRGLDYVIATARKPLPGT